MAEEHEHLIDVALALDGSLNVMAVPAPVLDDIPEYLIDVPAERRRSERFRSQDAQR
ncbi:hypothetical protein [Agrobacterium rosae]|uniref:Uncharacterized protein n=1 Tax=Agrobacterium rosae TaxID=1972867 RepID=A0AAW9FMP8_9HYPH|nr:hypothetical protein [Agrobacterium rosae]MDX8304406.1 hypothetical protein [Agrobacterium rosae]